MVHWLVLGQWDGVVLPYRCYAECFWDWLLYLFSRLAVTTSRSLVLADVLQQKLLLNRPVEYLAGELRVVGCVDTAQPW